MLIFYILFFYMLLLYAPFLYAPLYAYFYMHYLFLYANYFFSNPMTPIPFILLYFYFFFLFLFSSINIKNHIFKFILLILQAFQLVSLLKKTPKPKPNHPPFLIYCFIQRGNSSGTGRSTKVTDRGILLPWCRLTRTLATCN